ncbi:MAG: hypothetical protein AAGE94_20840 [Acidobacteriota bacterium]
MTTVIERSRPARDNPFRISRVEALRFRLSDAGWRRLLDRWATHDQRGALVGPHGSGKTTLMTEMARRSADGRPIRELSFSTEKHSFSTADRRTLDSLGADDLVTIDGVEQLTPWTRWRLGRALRTAGAVLVTSHRPTFLPTIHEHRTDPELLIELVAELAPDLIDRLARELPSLHARLDGDVRRCFFALYDRWAEDAIR